MVRRDRLESRRRARASTTFVPRQVILHRGRRRTAASDSWERASGSESLSRTDHPFAPLHRATKRRVGRLAAGRKRSSIESADNPLPRVWSDDRNVHFLWVDAGRRRRSRRSRVPGPGPRCDPERLHRVPGGRQRRLGRQVVAAPGIGGPARRLARDTERGPAGRADRRASRQRSDRGVPSGRPDAALLHR